MWADVFWFVGRLYQLTNLPHFSFFIRTTPNTVVFYKKDAGLFVVIDGFVAYQT